MEKIQKQREDDDYNEPSAKPGRGPDLQPRQHQPRVMDSAVGESPRDWTKLDISRSLRVLRVGTVEQIDRELRKLHLRWWHATRKQMEATLKAGGIPRKTLDRIPGVIDTCRECRAWTLSKPDVIPTVELTTKQNETVEQEMQGFQHDR